MSIGTPIRRAAACASRNVASAFAILLGLTSTATRLALGTSSRNSPSRFGTASCEKKLKPSHVAARLREARDQTKPDRVVADTKHDRDRGRSFCRQLSGNSAGRGDHCDAATNQIGHQCRDAIILAFQPVIFDRDVLALDKVKFAGALSERSHITRVGIGRRCADVSDNGECRLLRQRCDRIDRRGAQPPQ